MNRPMLTWRRIAVSTLLTLTAAVALAASGWWFLVREDNDLATSAPEIPQDLVASTAPSIIGTASASPGAQPSGTQSFAILPERSEAAYFADEKLASLPLPSTAKGSTTAIEGTFYLTADGLALDPSRTSAFTVDLATIKSDKTMRDQRVQNQALETATYPTATFTATSVSGYDPGIAEGEEQALQLTGIMDLHGVKREITWDVKARQRGDLITALATVDVKYADFDIPVLNVAGFVSVEDNVTLQVTVVAAAT